jgi:hypothetical protein
MHTVNVLPVKDETPGAEKLGLGGTASLADLERLAGEAPWSIEKIAAAAARGIGLPDDPALIQQYTESLTAEANK